MLNPIEIGQPSNPITDTAISPVRLRLGAVLPAAVEIAVGFAGGRTNAHVPILCPARQGLRADNTLDTVWSDEIACDRTGGLPRIGIANLHDHRAPIGRERADERRRAIRPRPQDK